MVYKSRGSRTCWGAIQSGWMYDHGYGVSKDYAEAVKAYMKSAEKGNSEAQYNLGLAYKTGKAIAKDKAGERKWFQKAADQGHYSAKKELREMGK